MSHRILLRTVVLDYPADVHDRARDFWRSALDGAIRRGTYHPAYHVLEHPAALATVLVQQIEEGTSRVHLDIESDDPAAEVDRLLAVGAVEVDRIEDWVVLRDPGGLLFCVIPALLDEDFARSAHQVGD